MLPLTTLLIRLTLAVIIGGIIGAEREYRNKSAGFRTMIMISLGACLFTIFSEHIGSPNNVDRIASNIVTGIGFLGAGIIFRTDDSVKGLTTAVTIWLVAALGIGIGDGYYSASLLGCALSMIVLVGFTYLESWIDRNNQIRNYKIVCPYIDGQIKHYEKLLQRNKLKFRRGKHARYGNDLSSTWFVIGTEKNHEHFIKIILNDPKVTSFEF